MRRKGFTLIELLIVLLVLAAIFTAGLNNIWDWFQEHIWSPFWKIFYPPTPIQGPLALVTGLFYFLYLKIKILPLSTFCTTSAPIAASAKILSKANQ